MSELFTERNASYSTRRHASVYINFRRSLFNPERFYAKPDLRIAGDKPVPAQPDVKDRRFYEEQYLGAADLTAAVDYGRVQQARHTLGAHTWGIAAGLQLKEKDSSAGGGQVEVFIQPGYAWDGFGRPIVVLAPYRIPAELFKSIPFDANVPAGQLIKVWLRYHESATQRARSGFEVCDRADQFSRVQETFRVEIGDRNKHEDRHTPISVAGYLVDAQETLHKLDPSDPQLLYDESVPYQNFPDAGAPARWLIPMGAVRWQPNSDPNQPGAFAKRSKDDLTLSRKLRRYIGVVAEAVEAADGRIRMKRRGQDDPPVVSNDLVWVEGDLRVEGDVHLFNSKLDFRDSSGLDNNGIPLSIQRVDLPGASGSLQVVIGRSDNGANTFAVGPLDGNKTFAAKLTVRDDGNVGIGTDAPGFKLDVADRMRVRQGSAQSAGISFFQNTPNADRAFVGMADDNQVGFFGGTGGGWGLVMDTTSGNVGIGTLTPQAKLQVTGGAIMPAVGNSATSGIQFPSNPGSGGFDEAFIRYFVEAGETTKLRIGCQNDADDTIGFFQFGSERMTIHGGNVGIGTPTPVCKLHVIDSLSANATNVNAHVAVIENSHPGALADVLALKVGASPPLTGEHNFITFFAGNSAVGGIEGNGSGVALNSSGADFAECLPRLDPDEVIEEGDIVGVFAGKISKRTQGADHVTVISRQPIMVGNLPPMGDEHLVNKVVVVGQVRGKVRGAVQAGDFIIPSGDDDGVGMAITPDQFTAKGCAQVVGRAWESSDVVAIKTINTAVGFVASAVGEALVSMLRDQQEEIATLRTEIRKLAVTRAS